ncbi:RICIN domain-containing protein [Streptomyces sp. NPDC101150]|uniref:RICIN domain-containing protein n=1 Tax=Streptomyces sp. NPDC101150 TaxID=3366114 RepID=UPI0037F9BBAF
MAGISDGVYRIEFTHGQRLTAWETHPGSPVVLLPPGGGASQEWRVVGDGNGGHSIGIPDAPAFVSYEGEPGLRGSSLLLPEPRAWKLSPGPEPDTFFIGVDGEPMRLGPSPLRIYPQRLALGPECDEPYQAWGFRKFS